VHLHYFLSVYMSTQVSRQAASTRRLQNISEMRVLEIGQVRSVSVLLVDLVTEGRRRFISLLVAVHEQHSETDG
jgi:hypothetical protein